MSQGIWTEYKGNGRIVEPAAMPSTLELIDALRVATFALESAVYLQGMSTLAPPAEKARSVLDRANSARKQELGL